MAAPPKPPPASASPALEPVIAPAQDQSHWDMRLSQMPREPKPDLALEPLPLPPTQVMPRAAPAPGPAPAWRPSPAPTSRRSDSTVEVDVGPVEIRLRRARSGKRVAAWVLDGVPFVVAFAAALRLALDSLQQPAPLDLLGYVELAGREAQGITGPIFAGALVLFAVYHTLAHGLGGATLGKRLVGIRVVRRDGRPPGLGRAALRAVLAVLSLALVGLGVLLALFTASGRAFHDLLARTWVVEAP